MKNKTNGGENFPDTSQFIRLSQVRGERTMSLFPSIKYDLQNASHPRIH